MISALSKLSHDERGATAIEYGLIVALIAIVAVAAFGLVGTSLSSVFDTVAVNL
jgi:pilus assembly protein Flp/PilA